MTRMLPEVSGLPSRRPFLMMVLLVPWPVCFFSNNQQCSLSLMEVLSANSLMLMEVCSAKYFSSTAVGLWKRSRQNAWLMVLRNTRLTWWAAWVGFLLCRERGNTQISRYRYRTYYYDKGFVFTSVQLCREPRDAWIRESPVVCSLFVTTSGWPDRLLNRWTDDAAYLLLPLFHHTEYSTVPECNRPLSFRTPVI